MRLNYYAEVASSIWSTECKKNGWRYESGSWMGEMTYIINKRIKICDVFCNKDNYMGLRTKNFRNVSHGVFT